MHDEHLHHSAPGHHRPELSTWAAAHAHPRRGRRARLRHDRAVQPRPERRERHLQRRTMPASGCPTFTSIAATRTALFIGDRGHRQRVPDRREHERRQRHARTSNSRPAISSAASTWPSRRATRTTSTRRCSRSRRTTTAAAATRTAASSACGPRTDGGTTWTFMAGSAGVSLRNCGNGASAAAATIRRTGTTRAWPSIRTTRTVSSSTPSTSGSRRAPARPFND